MDTSFLNNTSHLKLTDPGFGNSRKIGILLCAEVFYDLLSIGQVGSFGKRFTYSSKTRLG